VEIPGGGRWTTAKIVSCTVCEFSWRSRTSVNAVLAYQQERAERAVKKEREKEKIKKRKNKI
jgi:hypothetical protein